MPIYHMPIPGVPKLLAKITIAPMLKSQSAQKCLTLLLGRAGYVDIIDSSMPYYYYNNSKEVNLLVDCRYDKNEVASRVKILVDATYLTGELPKLLDLIYGVHENNKIELEKAISEKEIMRINRIICDIVANTTFH